MRQFFISMTATLLLCVGHAYAYTDYFDKQWIVQRDSARTGWTNLLPLGAKLLSVFGRAQEFALVQANEAPKRGRGIVYAQRNFRYRSFDDPDFGYSWGLQNTGQALPNNVITTAGRDIHAVEAWSIHTGNPNFIVAILDTGIQSLHEDLYGQTWSNPAETQNGIDDDGNGLVDDVAGWNFVDDTADLSDRNGHGTFIAGIIGARGDNQRGTRGVCPEVSLMMLKVLDDNGFGSTERAVRAIQYAIANHARVINISWGGAAADPLLEATLREAAEKNILTVTASGNDGNDNDNGPRPIYPASYESDGILSVAAYDARDRLAPFSNYGTKHVHLGAPGVAIYSTRGGGYAWSEGTSFAAPFVTGAAALLLSKFPTLTLKEAKERLMASSDVIDYYQRYRTASAGRVNAFNALSNIRPPRLQPPADWTGTEVSLATAHPYEPRTQQVFEVSYPGAQHIRVRFTGFRTEAHFDKVVLRDRQGVAVLDYSGKLGDFWSADAIGDTLRIEFTSDHSNQDYGFEINRIEGSFSR